MVKLPIYDEFTPPGNDYSSSKKAHDWNELKTRIRADLDLSFLPLKHSDVLLDIGCGAGFHLKEACNVCRHVHGLDVSERMLEIANKMLTEHGISNATLHHAGFLSFHDLRPSPTSVFSWGALHHLPDFWKFVALLNVSRALPIGGLFCLMDMVYSFPHQHFKEYQERFVEDVRREQGTDVMEDVIRALTQEFITFASVLEELIKSAGFRIVEKSSLPSKCWTNYLLQKTSSV